MWFEVRVGPALEEYGGPPDDEPDAFIQTGGWGLFADCAWRGQDVVIAFNSDDLDQVAAAASLDVGDADVTTVALAIQPHGDEIRVEYWLESQEGREVRQEEHPLAAPAFEGVLQRYLVDNHDAV